MTINNLISSITGKQSYLCVGLDPDLSKMPELFKGFREPLFEFNRLILDAIHLYAVAVKPNFAFYESQGIKGMQQLRKTILYIRKHYPELLIIADAKRGDIGNTSEMYAREVFEILKCDAVTLSPYMGKDSIEPFLNYKNKWVILLAITSNPGAADFQMLKIQSGRYLYEEIIKKAINWGNPDKIMFVTGATQPEALSKIRQIAPEHFFLVPGIGAQGGSLQQVSYAAMNSNCGLLVNASRSILYASKDKDFAQKAQSEAYRLQQEMKKMLEQKFLP